MSFNISDLWSTGGKFDPVKAATSAAAAAGIYGAFNPQSSVGRFLGSGSRQQPVGYTGGIPEYGVTRSLLPDAFSTTTPTGEPRRPGSGGRRYFTDATFTPTGRTMSEAMAPMSGAAQTRPTSPSAGLFEALPEEAIISLLANLFGSGGITAGDGTTTQQFAMGGLASLPETKGYYLGGPTDGMADEIPATIEGTQPAALSDGEFVIPADVVSHLGNGNSDAGAQKLYDMMDRIREARTGRKEQGREINPNKYLPV